MADNPELYRERAVIERANAANATLDMVRERCERAANAWDEMANQHARMDEKRIERQALLARVSTVP